QVVRHARVSRARTSSSDWLFSRIFLRSSPDCRRSLNSSSAICSAVNTATDCVSGVRACFCVSRILLSTKAATALTQRSSSSVLRAYLTPAICTVTERFIDCAAYTYLDGGAVGDAGGGGGGGPGGARGAAMRAPPEYAASPVGRPAASHQRHCPS